MLTRASFHDFKNLRDVHVDLTPLTVLVGPNGGGKTSVLQGLFLITEAVRHVRLGKAPPSDFLRDFSAGRFVRFGRNRYDLTVTADAPPLSTVTLRIITGKPTGDAYTLEVGGHHQPIDEHPSVLRKSGLPSLDPYPAASVLLQLDPTKMVRPSAIDRAEPTLAPDGAGLASVLLYLAGAHPDRKEAIEADVAAIVPWFRRVSVVPTRVERTPASVAERLEASTVGFWGQQFAVQTNDGSVVPAELVSEGTVLALGLLTLLHAPNPPQLLLLDDIDRGLHLGAQVRLVHTLRQLQQARPELQIVASSHSPFLLQELAAEEVRVLGLNEDGVHCRALTDHPEYARWKGALGTGEIWANLGEDWVGDRG